ncbi:hypothetical protein [uncultured Sphaerochaeta sp.]|uniref:hypothetical protein n=1 Tax=uncultured Sphaerochaeta sp. TaxID=886478 RepID=UPI002A0A3536|nr:hypothetical protein [uncultured Sphaerochaeta sp.]
MFCQICGNFSDAIVCPVCKEILENAAFAHRYASHCLTCGYPIADAVYTCSNCSQGLLSYGRYIPPLSTLLGRYKFSCEKSLAKVLVPLYQSLLIHLKNPVLVPVPASKKGLHDRGFDQMAYLCKSLESMHDYPVLSLLKARGKGEQKFLSREQRKLRAGYKVIKNKKSLVESYAKKGYSFVLIDDISTTGRTLEVCADMLLEAYGIKPQAIVLALA